MDMRLGFLQEFTSKASWDSLGKTGGVVDEVMKGSDCVFTESTFGTDDTDREKKFGRRRSGASLFIPTPILGCSTR